MSGTFIPCSPYCRTPLFCMEYQGCGSYATLPIVQIVTDHHDSEPDMYMCPATGICTMQDRCKASNNQCAVHEMSSVVRQLTDLLGHTNVWVLSGGNFGDALVEAWLDGSVWPISEERRNLRFALDCLDDAMGYKGMSAIYRWFVERSAGIYNPLEAIAAGRYDVVIQSLEELIGTPA